MYPGDDVHRGQAAFATATRRCCSTIKFPSRLSFLAVFTVAFQNSRFTVILFSTFRPHFPPHITSHSSSLIFPRLLVFHPLATTKFVATHQQHHHCRYNHRSPLSLRCRLIKAVFRSCYIDTNPPFEQSDHHQARDLKWNQIKNHQA